jgi:hypothetical protein
MNRKGFTTAQVEALRGLAAEAPPSERPATNVRPTTIPTIKSTHECDLPPDPDQGEFYQCSTCGWWWECGRLRSQLSGAAFDRRSSWYVAVAHRKAALLERRTAKRIARYQARKKTTA